jgi:hypothetical protein
MPFECPKTLNDVPVDNLFSFDFTTNVNGTESTNINYITNPITLSTKSFNYDILQINKTNKGINDPISKHWPLIETWKSKSVKKKIKIFGKTYEIKIPLYKPTQAYYEIYTKKKTAKITFFTIPSFKFQFNSDISWSGDIKCNFSLSCESNGACILSVATADLIDNYYNDGIKILEMTNANDRTTRIEDMLSNKYFYLYASSSLLLTYLLRDGLAANFTILNASGKLNLNVNSFYIEFGDLNITIPKFQMQIDLTDILTDPITGKPHPVTVSGSPTSGLTVTVQLLQIPNGDFFGLMITSLQNTLDLAKKATGTDYDEIYIQELENILAQLENADDSVTKWIKEYLGISYAITISFVFCPAGMSAVPPTPFYIKIEFTFDINPYKILDDLFDAAELIEKAMDIFENDLLTDVEDIGPSFAHPIEHMIQGALNTLNKELKSATDSGKKLIDNKYINRIYSPTLKGSFPIVPPA